ncbi:MULTISPECIES: DUF2157 domain-containing protein [Exiguobacterium]|uniref:DUF2157 domain-containing protein n=1 Tax=Exiguobacterium TaxID=33986 RepID=UPI00087759CA|nr:MULTISPECIES: DUF2157 domain-containing protein [Exiguobacterium]TCI45371.1 DUF2157 domain-containing protein [Exiguobacterium sp. SH5S32]TCI52573.1 DUF2157 domain-containing protein [Exiguobacterium sp. SH1S4]TCI65345.1 DUF2157 domain-containing protein [Exiguobacterium sp. SH0S2]TCI70761.1 DUF2157 domain-containing protein [Exiguobacterium sp. SH1S1]TCI80235.1 DUF2157 domain-containing protein [Exiguobacterium sp. SH0S1]
MIQVSIDKKVREWKEAGLLDETTGQRLIDFEYKKLAVSDKREHKPPILVIIGSILLALSLFSFVAANWQAIPDLVKVSIFLVFMLGMYVAAERLQVKAPRYVTLFRVLGVVFFVATMIVIFTTYNLSSQLPLLFWLFFAVAVLHKLIYKHPIFTFIAALAAFLAVTNSFQGIGITLILFGLLVTWVWFHYGDNELDRIFAWFSFYGLLLTIGQYIDYEGRFWPLWALAALHILFLVYRERAQWQYLYLFVAAILSIGYLVNATEGWLSQRQPSVIEATLLSVVLVAVYLTHRRPDLLWVSLLAVIPFSLFEDSGILLAILLEVVALAYLIMQDHERKPIVLAFIYFLLVQMTIYFIYVWDRLDISLFFLIGALIVFALSLALWWRSRTRGDART